MVCNEVRERLSEYLDDALPIQTKARVDQHLSVCPACREELALLKTLVRKLEALEPVSAPSGFLDEIHGRLDQGTWFKRMIRVLFFPLRLKVSLQVSGAVFAAFLIFSILTVERTNQRFIPQSSVPKQNENAIPEDKAAKTLAPATPSPAPQERPSPASVGPGLESPDEARRPARQTGATAARPSAAEDSAKDRKELERAKETEKLTDELGAVGKAAGRIGGVEVVLRVPSAQFDGPPDHQTNMKTDAGERRVASKLAGSENTEDKSDMKKVNGPLLQKFRALVEGCRGSILEAGYQAQSGKLDRLRIEIPTSQSAAFFSGLGALGEIPSTPAVTHIADTVQVIIYVLEAK